jgi:copper transport protein
MTTGTRSHRRATLAVSGGRSVAHRDDASMSATSACPHRRRRSGLLVLAAALALIAGLWSSGGVAAHAELLEITPTDGQLLDAAPAEVVLRWSEPVSVTGGSARVLDDTGAVVSGDARVDGTTVAIPISGDLRDGTYTIAWAVISEDSHPISGATVFYVGQPSTSGPVDAGVGGGAGWGVRTGAAILTSLAYGGALIAAGTWWFLVVAGPVDRTLRRLISAIAERAAVLGAVAAVAAVPLRIARIGGGLGALRENALLAESLKGPIGMSTLVTAVALLVLAGMTGRDGEGGLLDRVGALAGIVALAGFALEGHTRSQRPVALMATFDVVHLAAGAVWLGGIVALVVAFRAGTGADALGRVVGRFSTLAVFAVVAVVGAGIGMAIIVLPSPGDLVQTGYGLALLTKAALVVPVIAMGAYNRRRLVPAVAVGVSDVGPPEQQRVRLRRVVTVELVLLLAVVAVTSVLVTRSPIASSAAPPPVTAVPPDAVELALSGGAGTALFTIAPARAGQNDLYLALQDADGQPLDPVETPTVELTEPTLGVGPLRPVVHPLATGEYHVIADIPLAGTYRMVVRVRVADFVAAAAETTITID